jgi:hypothetical protein
LNAPSSAGQCGGRSTPPENDEDHHGTGEQFERRCLGNGIDGHY